ncbi:drug resistance transporter, EmrB/QacA subfamily [Thermomonospora echinospora]|uniref:Drug resistance transporter, EmrB/QacA subfamily n=1 Tax=Thermomonospora echinospora TaxID=1992 RepID=A0A1H5XI37_9ACTN|nr:MFS transporter [Thermomonospora echinospora]SEG11418.1 drug resistance transporter, EmrB/QacA subfamily [Thermomonospora echinospora]
MTQTSARPRAGTRPEPYRWRWLALAVILAAEVMDLLDATVTNIAAPSIRADLGGSYAALQWLGAAYTLAMAVGLITGGRLGDIYGRKRLFLLGAAGFTAASLACALAQSPGTLIGMRAVQGAFGAVLIPQGLGLIKEMFDDTEMGAAFGAFGPVMGLSAVGGPILAGWLVDADLFGTGWRMIFLINLPLGLAVLVAGVRLLPESRSPRATRLDLVGALLATLGSVLLVHPLVQGRELGWPAWTFAMMAGSVAVFAVFAWYERRVARAGGDPLVTPELFRSRAFSGGLLFGTLFFAGMIGYNLAFNLFTQLGLGYSPLKAGLAGAPWALGMVVGFGATQGLARRHGRVAMQLGTLVMAAGAAGLYGTLRWAGTGVTAWDMAPALLVTGFGTSMVMAPFFNIVLAGVRPHQTGSASGSLTAVQQLGGALGIALLGTLFFGVLGGQVADGADAVTPRVRAELTAAGVPAGTADRIVTAMRECARGRATAEDPQHVPAGCAAAEAAVRSAAAAHPVAAGRIGAVVADGGQEAAERGFIRSLERTLVLELALLVLACGLTFLLPRHALEDGPTGH